MLTDMRVSELLSFDWHLSFTRALFKIMLTSQWHRCQLDTAVFESLPSKSGALQPQNLNAEAEMHQAYLWQQESVLWSDCFASGNLSLSDAKTSLTFTFPLSDTCRLLTCQKSSNLWYFFSPPLNREILGCLTFWTLSGSFPEACQIASQRWIAEDVSQRLGPQSLHKVLHPTEASEQNCGAVEHRLQFLHRIAGQRHGGTKIAQIRLHVSVFDVVSVLSSLCSLLGVSNSSQAKVVWSFVKAELRTLAVRRRVPVAVRVNPGTGNVPGGSDDKDPEN